MVLCLCPTLISRTSRDFVQLVEDVLSGGALAQFFLVGANCVVQQALLPLALQLQRLLDHVVRVLKVYAFRPCHLHRGAECFADWGILRAPSRLRSAPTRERTAGSSR